MNEQKREVDGQAVTASIWAGPPSKATLVLLHGFPMDRHLWDAVGEKLAGSRPIVAIDLPGFGGSGSDDSVLGMPETADWLTRALDAYNIDTPVILAGLSMGGYIAMEFAARHCERLERLVLCSTKAESDGDAARKARIEMAEAVDHIGIEAIAETMLAKVLARSTRKSRPSVVQRLREMIENVAPSSVAAAQRGMAARRSMLERLPQWELRIDCIAGEEDSLTGPEVMQRIVDAASDAALHRIPHAGHVPPLEDPDAFSQCLRQIL